MNGRKNRRKKKGTRNKPMGNTGGGEREVTPMLPTSGQILGVLVRALGINHPELRSKTAQRYFSGRLENRVKESSRENIIGAIAETLAGSVFISASASGNGNGGSITPPALADILGWHTVNWDRFRAFMQPRMMRVYPSHLAPVWRAYIRLAAIDLALRVAAHIHIAGASPRALEFLEWASVSRRGEYLNSKRSESGVSLNAFAESVGVSDNTVEAWLYHGARPSDDNLVSIANALSLDTNETVRLTQELRQIYWASDIAEILAKFIGTEAADEIVGNLRRYASLVCNTINDRISETTRADVLGSLSALGSHSEFSPALLAALVPHEPDGEWKEELRAAGSNWIHRLLAVNLQVHRAEEDALIRETEGRQLTDWDVSNPKAYAHYQRSMELQIQGRIHEAIAEVARAAELDPLDPANHFTLGSAKGTIGAKNGDAALVKEGIESCWLAVTLDPAWVLPWTEIGLILLRVGKPREAVEHLEAIGPERCPLDTRYYSTLGAALRELGRYGESLKAFESSLELDPDDPPVVVAAAVTAVLADDNSKSTRYARTARHLGASEDLDMELKLVKFLKPQAQPVNMADDSDRLMAALDAAIKRNPNDASLYFRRGREHFAREDDSRAISDLDSVIRLTPDYAQAYLIRGIVYGYTGQYDQVVADMGELIRLEPDNATAHYRRGLAYGEMDELDLAIADLEETIRLEPDNADAYRGKGDCLRYKGEYDLAIADYEAALAIDPEHASSYRGRGAAYRMKGEHDRAIADYDSAISLNPQDFYAYRFRGDAYLAAGEYDRAIADCDAALSISGDDDVAYFHRGNANLLSGNLEQAMADFNSAIRRNPGSAHSIYARGLVRELTGDAAGAEEDYNWARELGYDHSD